MNSMAKEVLGRKKVKSKVVKEVKPEPEQVVRLTGYPVSIKEVVDHFVKTMHFNGDENNKPDAENYTYYLDPVQGVVLLNLAITVK